MFNYRKITGYKYQLVEDFIIDIAVFPDSDIVNPFMCLLASGRLIIKKGYSWDGPSGPTIDTKSFMRGSLVHDALYQLMREKHINIDKRDKADQLLKQQCIKDGMSRIRAWIVYKAVKWFGKKSALSSEEETKLFYAP